MQSVFEHFQIDLDKCNPALHILHIPFAKRNKGSCCNARRRGKGGKRDGFNIHFFVIFYYFQFYSLRELMNETLSSSCLALLYKCWGNAYLACAGGWQGPVHCPHCAAPSFLLCSPRSPFLYILHHSHCFSLSLQMPSNNLATLFSFENLDVLNFVFNKQLVEKVDSLRNAVNLWTNRL